jgi:2-oxo-4-hydroxy-4-carboxy-5-ureidoimidazoline decarboxylase
MSESLTLRELNEMDLDTFQVRLGKIYEHSPWVAALAADGRPFATIDALHARMEKEVASATHGRQVALIRAHPQLKGRLADPSTLTDASRREQSGAGLNQCTQDQVDRLQQLNQAYLDRFGFPFIVAVRGLDTDGIIARMRERLANTPEQEFQVCLEQVGRIARFRLNELIAA